MAPNSEVLSWRGQTALDSDGDKIGKIEEIYLDAQTNEPEWAVINTGLFGNKQSFVPLRNASVSGDGISLPYDKSTVKDAPKIDPDGRLSTEEESELYRHYEMDYGNGGGSGSGVSDVGDVDRSDVDRSDLDTTAGGRTGTGTTDSGRDVSGPNTDDAMTRSEEELTVGKAQRETGRARLKKYIVEDEVTQTVPVQREELRIEREPITDANVDAATDGPELSEEEHEVVLHEEQAVAEKRVVPKERVRLDKDVHTDEHEVSETVRKEQLDIDDSSGRS